MKRGRAGFSLLEVMVALAILAIALPILLQAIGRSLSLAAEARFLAIAAPLAQERLVARGQERLSGRRPAGADEGRFPPPFSVYSWRARRERWPAGDFLPPGVSLWRESVEVRDERRPGSSYRLERFSLQGEEW